MRTTTLDGRIIFAQTAHFYTTAGDTWIYNRQGDKVAEVPDDRLREEILRLLIKNYGETE